MNIISSSNNRKLPVVTLKQLSTTTNQQQQQQQSSIDATINKIATSSSSSIMDDYDESRILKSLSDETKHQPQQQQSIQNGCILDDSLTSLTWLQNLNLLKANNAKNNTTNNNSTNSSVIASTAVNDSTINNKNVNYMLFTYISIIIFEKKTLVFNSIWSEHLINMKQQLKYYIIYTLSTIISFILQYDIIVWHNSPKKLKYEFIANYIGKSEKKKIYVIIFFNTDKYLLIFVFKNSLHLK